MANRGKTACGTTILRRSRMIGKEIDKRGWWTVGVDCGEERRRFVVVDDRGERQRIGIGAKWIAIGSDRIGARSVP